MHRRPRIIAAFRAALILGSLPAIGVAAANLAPPTAGGSVALWLATSFAVMLAAESVTVSNTTRGNNIQWSLGAAAIVGLVLTAGPWVTLFAAVGASLAIDVASRRDAWPTLESACETAISVACAGGAFLLLGGTPGSISLPADYLALTALVAGYAALNVGLMLVARSSAQSPQPRGTLVDELRAFPQNALLICTEGCLGVVIAVLFAWTPWALPLAVPLVLSLHLATLRGVRLNAVTDEALEAFANIVDDRDRYTAEHSLRVCELSMMIAAEMGLSPATSERLYWTSRLHDLGKISVDNSILNKPGRLTDEEFDVIRRHPVVSARVLSAFAFREHDAEIVLCHHERYDGRGYLKRPASEVPLESFIIAVADTYDAMTSDRPYRRALPREVALEEIERNIGTQFHPVPAHAFLRAMGWQPGAHAGGARGGYERTGTGAHRSGTVTPSRKAA